MRVIKEGDLGFGKCSECFEDHKLLIQFHMASDEDYRHADHGDACEICLACLNRAVQALAEHHTKCDRD